MCVLLPYGHDTFSTILITKDSDFMAVDDITEANTDE